MSQFQSRPDGEYKQCARCAKKGYGEDSWHPATPEYWPMRGGRLSLFRCKACCGEVMAHKNGVVPATAVAA